ncbi:hypothetical protein [Nocardia sp. NBC_01327]|uniref:hypothetical protein n=1 Tax=Nocardia sp. NBC_01327 TaxID=2903593 RepID=UPI002E13801E|nr:hypothetical protein OG326_42610 [Nocardia sp. NBC_01327]
MQIATELKHLGVAPKKTLDEVTSVVAALEAGEKNNAIAASTGISHHTVQSILVAFEALSGAGEGDTTQGTLLELRK